MSEDFLTEVRSYLAELDMSPSYFGKAACGNSELVERLEAGKTVTLATVQKVRNFVAARREASAKAKEPAE